MLRSSIVQAGERARGWAAGGLVVSLREMTSGWAQAKGRESVGEKWQLSERGRARSRQRWPREETGSPVLRPACLCSFTSRTKDRGWRSFPRPLPESEVASGLAYKSAGSSSGLTVAIPTWLSPSPSWALVSPSWWPE